MFGGGGVRVVGGGGGGGGLGGGGRDRQTEIDRDRETDDSQILVYPSILLFCMTMGLDRIFQEALRKRKTPSNKVTTVAWDTKRPKERRKSVPPPPPPPLRLVTLKIRDNTYSDKRRTLNLGP